MQGVGYRWWAIQQAVRMGLDGWVRNRRDGSVELLAIGPAAALDALVDAAGAGPAAASVSSVERADATDDGSIGFSERATP